MVIFFKESLKFKVNKNTILTSYVNILKDIIKNVSNLDSAILSLMNARNELNYNVNVSLLLLETLTSIFEV